MIFLITLFSFSFRSWKNTHLRENIPEFRKPAESSTNFTNMFILINKFLTTGISIEDITKNADLELTIDAITDYTKKFKNTATIDTFDLEVFNPEDYKDFLINTYYPITNNLSKKAKLKQYTYAYDYIVENKNYFDSYITVADEIGPAAAKLLNIDYQKLSSTVKLIFQNADTVTYGEILDKLGINSDLLNVGQTLCKFLTSNASIGELISSLGASGLNELINAVSSFVPKDAKDSTGFINIEKVYNIVEPFVKLGESLFDRINNHLENLLKPIINSYVLSPIDIITKGISDRASGLIELLEKVNSYKGIKEDDDPKNIVYSFVNDNLGFVCDDDCNPFEKSIELLKPLTNPKVNLTAVFSNFGVPAHYVKFGSGLLANLTDKSKTIVDLAYGIGEFIRENGDEMMLPIEGVFDDKDDFSIMDLASKAEILLNFLKDVNVNSDFFDLFKQIKITNKVDYLNKEYIQQIANKSLNVYDYPLFEDYYIEETIKDAQDIIKGLLNSTVTLINQYPDVLNNSNAKEWLKLGSDLTITLPNILSKITEIFLNEKLTAGKGLLTIGKFIELFRGTLDRKVPSIVKDIPFFGSFYKTINDDFARFAGVLQKENSKISDVLNSFYDGIGVLAEMIQSACSLIYANQIAIPKIIEGVKPTSFINVFETMKAVSNLKKYSAIDLVGCIIYGETPKLRLLSATISINDILPVKTVVEGSPQISSGITTKSLSVSKVADAVKIETTTITNMVKSVGNTVGASPVSAIKKVAVDSFGADPEKFDKAAEGIKNIGEATMKGEIADTNIEITEKDSKLSTGAIAGIAVGCVVVVGLIIFLGVYFGVLRKKRSNTSSSTGKKAEQ